MNMHPHSVPEQTLVSEQCLLWWSYACTKVYRAKATLYFYVAFTCFCSLKATGLCADCQQRWVSGGSSLTKPDLTILFTMITLSPNSSWNRCMQLCVHIAQLHFELYGELHMPNIPVRLGGNYHDLYEAHSSVSLNHTAGLSHRKTSQPDWRRDATYSTCSSKWNSDVLAAGGNFSLQTQNRPAVIYQCRLMGALITAEMSGCQNSPSCSFSILETSSTSQHDHLPTFSTAQQCYSNAWRSILQLRGLLLL